MSLDDSVLLLNILTKLAEVSPEDSKGHQTVLYMALNEETKDYYIGATTNKTNRKNQHKSSLDHGKTNDMHHKRHHNAKFQQSYNNNSNFEWKELPIEDPEIAFKLEKILIDSCINKDPHCLNMQTGSPPPNLGKKRTPELVASLAASNTGRKHSEETKEKQRIAALKHWEDSEVRQKRSEKTKQQWASMTEADRESIILKIKQTNKKTYQNSELLEQKRLSSLEYWSKPENIQKQSELKKNQIANKEIILPWTGKPLSLERKEMISESVKKWQSSLSDQEKREHYLQISTPVAIEGINYSSIKEAAALTGIPNTTIRRKLDNDSYPGWYRL